MCCYVLGIPWQTDEDWNCKMGNAGHPAGHTQPASLHLLDKSKTFCTFCGCLSLSGSTMSYDLQQLQAYFVH